MYYPMMDFDLTQAQAAAGTADDVTNTQGGLGFGSARQPRPHAVQTQQSMR